MRKNEDDPKRGQYARLAASWPVRLLSLAWPARLHQPSIKRRYFIYFVNSNQISTNFGEELRPNTIYLWIKSRLKEIQKFDEDYKSIIFLSIWKLF